jgi:hypothetical protein
MLNLRSQPPVFTPTPYKLVWMSGASDPWSSALSEAEARCLASAEAPAGHVVEANFPYAGPRRVRRVPLALASVSNVAQFLVASTPLLRRLAVAHWVALCSSTPRVHVVVGSCGAQLLRALEPVTPPGTTVAALALGPVAWRLPRSVELAVVGDRDPLARVFLRRRERCEVQLAPGVGHLGYLDSEAVREQVTAWLRGVTRSPTVR